MIFKLTGSTDSDTLPPVSILNELLVKKTIIERLSYKLLIHSHVIDHGGRFQNWFVGITDDPQERRNEHNAVRGRNHWKSIDVGSWEEAVVLRDFCSKVLDMQVSPRLPSKSVYVYLYLPDSYSDESV